MMEHEIFKDNDSYLQAKKAKKMFDKLNDEAQKEAEDFKREHGYYKVEYEGVL